MSTPHDRTSSHPSDPPLHDPELPILRELEIEFEGELRALQSPARKTPRAERLRRPARITRRAVTLVVLLSLVGASALAGRSALTDSHKPSYSLGSALLSSGGHGTERWQLEAYLYNSSTCYALFVADTVSSACGAPPGAAGVRVTSAVSPTQRFVAGLTGASVSEVLVNVAGRTLLEPTHRPPDALAARRAKLPVRLRWFLAVLPGDAHSRGAPARVTPRDGTGRPLGAAVLDCSLGAAGAICQRAAGRIAAAGRGHG